ncbi:RND superfamily putative drug exporter [Microbacteriaceae bacterium SG_E_30_P1]|uniref:RND superfamily putative drug exporter n=1 Tax=Antiquaquibacter oligotrophicus TaxID=2880260 RepID=A0ABT6KLC2_9MICO|nr:MMPL family transporter [Antiquaquibacter oligotrophicus]MDH6179907.1 RND superfamily putative drug exporter [Antiquaquibacter oligotrophicus]UDF14333.1 MMPL family transporter [Antiquaquibacter oligotrophicus]
MLRSLGAWVARRRLTVLSVWAVLFVAGLGLSGAVFDSAAEIPNAPAGSESLEVARLVDEVDPGGPTVVAVIEGEDFFDRALIASASAVMEQIRAIPGVVTVTDAYTGGGLSSDDGRSSLAVIELDEGLSADDAVSVAREVASLLHTIEPADVLVGGEVLAEEAFVDLAITGAAIGEGAAILILLVLLVVILGGFRIGVLPVVTAITTIAVSLLVLSGLLSVVSVNEFAVNVVTVLGIGLAVDYGILVIFRFREERLRMPDPVDAVASAVDTAGRAVLVSAVIVCVSLAGLFLLGDPLLSGMAVGGAIAVVVAALASVTLVPAWISLVHRWIPSSGQRTWSRPRPRTGTDARRLVPRLAAFAQRRPALVTVSATLFLVILAAPLTTLTLGSSDIRSLPAGAEERRAYEATITRFDELGVEPIVVSVDGDIGDPAVVPILDRVAALPGVVDAEALIPDLPEGTAIIALTPEGDATGAAAQQLVRDVRAVDADLPIAVGGPAAELVDTLDHLAERLAIAAVVVLVATFVLLFALTRSVIVPLKTLLLNSLTIAATLGVVVAVFQWGWGAGILGFTPWGAVDASTPLLIGLLAFGLSMDYAVFLIARITEHWRARDRTLTPRAASDKAVLAGITQTAPVVTLAALAISIVFIGFAAGDLLAMKEVGVGMVVAILLDVTIIRGLLMPAVMTLLGSANWWAPRFARSRTVPAGGGAREGR